MEIHEKGSATVITDSGDLQGFVMKLTHEYRTFEGKNLIIDLSQNKALTRKDILLFGPLAKTHKKARRSLILVANDFNFNAAPASINVVPSMQEAFDMIEMDEIERDLGF